MLRGTYWWKPQCNTGWRKFQKQNLLMVQSEEFQLESSAKRNDSKISEFLMTFPCHFLCCFSWASEHLLSVAASAQAPDLMCPGVGLGHPTTVGEWGRPHYSLNDAKLWDHLRFKRECQPGTKVWRDQSKKKRLGHKTPPAWQFPFRTVCSPKAECMNSSASPTRKLGLEEVVKRTPSQRGWVPSRTHPRKGNLLTAPYIEGEKSDVCWFKLHLIQLQLGSCKKK